MDVDMDVCLRRMLRILLLMCSVSLCACVSYSPSSAEKYASVVEMSKDVARQFTPVMQKTLLLAGRNFSAFEDERVRGAAFKVQGERLDKRNIELSFRAYCSHHEGILYNTKNAQTGLFEYRCEPYLGGVLFSVLTQQTDFSQQTGRACLSFMVLEQKNIHMQVQADMYMAADSPSQRVFTTLAGC
jgi:hypothetical protein